MGFGGVWGERNIREAKTRKPYVSISTVQDLTTAGGGEVIWFLPEYLLGQDVLHNQIRPNVIVLVPRIPRDSKEGEACSFQPSYLAIPFSNP